MVDDSCYSSTDLYKTRGLDVIEVADNIFVKICKFKMIDQEVYC